MYEVIRTSDYLEHHGIKGMHWGIRRYQYEDGSLTPAGERRYGHLYTTDGKMRTNNRTDSSITKRVKNDYNNLSEGEFRKKYGASKQTYNKRVMKYEDPYKNSPLAKAGKKLAAKKNGKESNAVNDAKYAKEEIEKIQNSKSFDVDKAKKIAKIGIAATASVIATVGAVKAASIAKDLGIVDDLLTATKNTLNNRYSTVGLKKNRTIGKTINEGMKSYKTLRNRRTETMREQARRIVSNPNLSILSERFKGLDISSMTLNDLRKLDLY